MPSRKKKKERRREAKASVSDSTDWVCRKGNNNEVRPCYPCRWNSWFTKAKLGYDMDPGIEMGIDGDVRVGADGSSGWKMRQMNPLLKGELRHPPKRSWLGAARKG